MSNEIRKDYLLDRWTIIASERAKRPTDFAGRPSRTAEDKACPFCPGNEQMTPPAYLLCVPSEDGVRMEKDSDTTRTTNWLVRCIPNLYAALTPRKAVDFADDGLLRRRDGVGAHGVIIESPNHDEHPGTARLEQLELVVQAYMDALQSFSDWEYVQIFRNHGKEAGASLSHAHSQVIATPMIPKRVSDELQACRRWLKTEGSCPYCKIVEIERGGPRFIFENEGFVAFAPWASVHPFEFWIVPTRHQYTLLQLDATEKRAFSQILRACFGSLANALSDPPYSYGFHVAPNHGNYKYFHWHLEVYPKLSIQAGFEDSTDMFINVMPPETAAKSLRASLPKI